MLKSTIDGRVIHMQERLPSKFKKPSRRRAEAAIERLAAGKHTSEDVYVLQVLVKISY